MAGLNDARLYGILDLAYVAVPDAAGMAGRMLEGGVDVLQLRAKNFEPVGLASLARELAELCRAARVPFVVNDHPLLAADVGADGVHVGQDDMPLPEVRRVFDGIVGLSTHSLEQARAAADAGADYIGFGPLFATPTKPDYIPIGLADIPRVHAEVGVPIFCIGGIREETVDAVREAGARRIVVVSAILTAPDPGAKCRWFRDRMAG